MLENPMITYNELSVKLGKARSGITKQIKKLTCPHDSLCAKIIKIIENGVKIHIFLSGLITFIAFFAIFSRNIFISAREKKYIRILKNGYKSSMNISIEGFFLLLVP